MPLKLYKLDLSPPVCAALMICDIHKVPVEMVDVDLFNKDHLKPEYLEKNPLHTIPLLEDGDLFIHDSHVILTYLTEVYGKDDSLYPKDPKKRALVDQKLFFDNLLFNRAKNITYAALFEGVRKPPQKFMNDLVEVYEFIEAFLSKTKFIAGDNMTVADISIVSSVATTRNIIPIDGEKYPKFKAWFSYMEKQPFFQKCTAPGSEALAKILKEKLDV